MVSDRYGMGDPAQMRVGGWARCAARGALVALPVALVLAAGCGADYNDALPPPAGDGESAGGGAVVELSEWAISPAVIDAPAGREFVVDLTDVGEIEHDFTLESGAGTERLQPGDTETADLGVVNEEILAWCSIPGHRENGMEATVRVIG